MPYADYEEATHVLRIQVELVAGLQRESALLDEDEEYVEAARTRLVVAISHHGRVCGTTDLSEVIQTRETDPSTKQSLGRSMMYDAFWSDREGSTLTFETKLRRGRNDDLNRPRDENEVLQQKCFTLVIGIQESTEKEVIPIGLVTLPVSADLVGGTYRVRIPVMEWSSYENHQANVGCFPLSAETESRPSWKISSTSEVHLKLEIQEKEHNFETIVVFESPVGPDTLVGRNGDLDIRGPGGEVNNIPGKMSMQQNKLVRKKENRVDEAIVVGMIESRDRGVLRRLASRLTTLARCPSPSKLRGVRSSHTLLNNQDDKGLSADERHWFQLRRIARKHTDTGMTAAKSRDDRDAGLKGALGRGNQKNAMVHDEAIEQGSKVKKPFFVSCKSKKAYRSTVSEAASCDLPRMVSTEENADIVTTELHPDEIVSEQSMDVSSFVTLSTLSESLCSEFTTESPERIADDVPSKHLKTGRNKNGSINRPTYRSVSSMSESFFLPQCLELADIIAPSCLTGTNQQLLYLLEEDEEENSLDLVGEIVATTTRRKRSLLGRSEVHNSLIYDDEMNFEETMESLCQGSISHGGVDPPPRSQSTTLMSVQNFFTFEINHQDQIEWAGHKDEVSWAMDDGADCDSIAAESRI